MITAVTYLNTDLIKVTLSERARIDSDFLNPSNWVITASYGYSSANNVQVVSVLRPTDDSIVATDTIFLQTTTHSPSTIYRLSFVTLTNTEGLPFISYPPRVFPYRSRQTKIDQILKSTPNHFDKRTTSNIRNILTAISIEDDLIGGSRNDAFESLVVLGGGDPIEFIAPFFIISPTITGGTTPGDLLTCDPGTWGGTNPIAFNFQWRRDGVDIVGETLDLYTTVDADGGTDITCFVTLVNFVDSTSAESNLIAVDLSPPVFATPPAISGTYSIGSVLTCAPGTWTGTEPVTPTYQWRRDGVAIGGATASTYTVVSADYVDGTLLTCFVTLTNGAGTDTDMSNALTCPTDPLSIAGAALEVWHPAEDWNLAGSLIDTWYDRSGKGKHVLAAGAARPVVASGAFGVFDGCFITAGATYLRETAAMLSGNAPHTIFVYAQSSAVAAGGGYATVGATETATRATSTVGKWTGNQRWYGGDDDLSGLISSSDSTPRLYSKTYDGSVYAPRRSGVADGAPFAPGGPLNLSAGHSVGTFTSGSGGATTVTIGEVVIMSGVATGPQIAAMESYFTLKFGSI